MPINNIDLIIMYIFCFYILHLQVYYSLVERYNVVTGQIDQLPSLNVARTNHGCTRFRQNPTDTDYSLIVAGGWFNAQYTTKVSTFYFLHIKFFGPNLLGSIETITALKFDLIRSSILYNQCLFHNSCSVQV